ncbi:phosphate-starvation-inducible PsiE family protein [Mucilaginibacter jinjuensis]|uniref:Phosphate-starvation-inducible PsiE family protein n=1 Tax=Mucilaginibacter jinjuensis TaxID=1176721 RepID=A0ABY7T199_9SPHI|nr:phosphate-starvation-inducible PsiE family protein [Mucilaginibacter jinjuensis]WCT09994.1 phosphate-starvation-inducible PsiE family protein [Mucilaginibacter jinjuensis]
MENFFRYFEKYISYALMAIAMLFVCYQTIDLMFSFVFRLVHSIQDKTYVLEAKGRSIAGVFFTILLTLEIIQTIKVFSHNHSTKLKIILIVGLIAVTRKILIFDMEEVTPLAEFAIAALIISLSAGYFLVSRSEKSNVNESE